MIKKICILIILVTFLGILPNCEKNLTGPKLDEDPNKATEVTMESLFSSVQINSFWFNENFAAWIVSMWMQQMSGTGMTFENYGNYQIMEVVFDDPWKKAYCSAGLVNIEKLKSNANENDNRIVAGITKILEAFLMGTTASLWGDIPYSEVSSSETPKLDKQSAV